MSEWITQRIGLKLWSTNINYIEAARDVFQRGYCDFIELYLVPGSFEEFHRMWGALPVTFKVHAPHSLHGVNLADPGRKEYNRQIYDDVARWADELNASAIVFHPGINGYITETARQLIQFDDSRILIENKPLIPLHDRTIKCNGATYEEMEYLLSETKLGFCLDIGHCFCAANSLGIDPMVYVEKMLSLKPAYFHISDNDRHSELDAHKNLGQGTMPLESILHLIPPGMPIAIETEKSSTSDLDDFIRDSRFIRDAYVCSRLLLEPFSDLHIKKTFEWIQDSDLRRLFLMRGEPDWENHIKYFHQVLNDRSQKVYAIYADKVHVGNCGFKNINGKTAEIWIYIGDSSTWGQGLGRCSCRLLISKGREECGFEDFYVHIADFNRLSRSMFASVGFQEAVQSDHERDLWAGRDFDVVKMELTAKPLS